MTKPRGPRAQAVVDEMVGNWAWVLDTPRRQRECERAIEGTLRYQQAAFADALADLAHAILDVFRWRRV